MALGSLKPRKKGSPQQQSNLDYERCRMLLELAPIGVRRLSVVSHYCEPANDELYVRSFFDPELMAARRLKCMLLGGWLADANNG